MNTETNYDFRYLPEDEHEIWNDFVRDNQNGTLFHQTTHLKSISSVLNYRFAILAAYNKNNQLIAGMAFVYTRKFHISNILIPYLTPYYSPLISGSNKKYSSKEESYRHTVTHEFINELSKRYKIIQLTFSPNDSDIRPYIWSGFRTEVLYSYRISLDRDFTSEEVYNPDIKRRIKKAMDLEYEIRQGVSDEFIDNYYMLQLHSYKRQRAKFRLSSSQFGSYIAEMRTAGNICIYLLYYQSKPVSGIIVLFDKDIAYYFLAGSDPDYLSTGLNQVLFDYIVNELKDKNYSYYDLVGANTPSIAYYKSTYNFPLIAYYRVFKVYGRPARYLLKLKEVYERFKI
jgi:hypothetical protein